MVSVIRNSEPEMGVTGAKPYTYLLIFLVSIGLLKSPKYICCYSQITKNTILPFCIKKSKYEKNSCISIYIICAFAILDYDSPGLVKK
jgi:hypothetical protein